MSAADRVFLQACVELAARGRATCAPNPPVGCIIWRDGKVLGRGFHKQAGSGHAEVNALQQAGSDVRGATVFVSLEPCSFVGRTPACAQTLIDAGVARVVVAAVDPNPQVSGQGIAMLEAAGVEVEVVELASAKACIQGFVSRITRGRPFVRLKTATSLDGAVALSNGDSQWITGDAARSDVQYWRAHSDAIVTGIGSVLADDCQLTVRDSAFKHAHAPLRVVLDSRGRTPPDAKVLDEQAPTLLVHKVGHVDLSLPKAGHVQQLALAHGPNDLSSVLSDLAERGCNDVLVEAGPKVIGSFVRAGLWDEWIAYIAPKLLGADSHPATDLALARLPDAPQARLVETTQIGDDLRLTLRPRDL